MIIFIKLIKFRFNGVKVWRQKEAVFSDILASTNALFRWSWLPMTDDTGEIYCIWIFVGRRNNPRQISLINFYGEFLF